MAARSARLALAGGCAAVLALAACSAGSSTRARPAVSGSPAAGPSVPGSPGTASPGAGPSGAAVPGQPGAPPRLPGGHSPAQFQAAYDLEPLFSQGITGKGETIVIVDPFGSPTIKQDLAAYDRAWHLPPPPSFRVIAPAGPVPPFRPSGPRTGAAIETTLDVESAHLMAPGAGILLVETPTAETEGTAGFPEIVRAEEYVIRHRLGSVISMSLGATERTFPSGQSIMDLRSAITDAASADHMITMVAASGDVGAAGLMLNTKTVYRTPQISWPASDPLVVAVGGTRLGAQPAGTATAPATSWPESGGGRSAVFARPRFQNSLAGIAGRTRAIPDISMAGACESGLEMYITPGSIGSSRPWNVVCGTSLSAPLFAAVVALADQKAGRLLGPLTPLLYRMAARHDPGIVDVQGPGNTFSLNGTRVRGFPAGPGYDLVTGLGTIDAAKFVPDLARLALQERGPG
jgi:subtilase family serine protease